MNTAAIRTFFRHALTEADNETFDLLRIAAVLGVFVFNLLALLNWSAFEPISFGTGFGAVLLAAGGAFRLNEGGASTEHKPETP